MLERSVFLISPAVRWVCPAEAVCHGRKGRLPPAAPCLGPSSQEQLGSCDKGLQESQLPFLRSLVSCVPHLCSLSTAVGLLHASDFLWCCRTVSLSAAEAESWLLGQQRFYKAILKFLGSLLLNLLVLAQNSLVLRECLIPSLHPKHPRCPDTL